MQEKDLVEQIFTEKAKDDSNSNDLARTLELLSKTVFGEVNRFVFELLQNADDAASDNERQIDVKFQLTENHIIFSHDGEHFNANDVRGISSVASRSGEKDKAQEKTGYKGIGFKSIFGTATYAHILSGRYSFRFDKDHEAWNGRAHLYPWQVIPIWTDEPIDEVKDRLDRNRVITIINVANREVLRREVIKVFEDCQIILFLRRVHRITFFDGDAKIFEIEKRKGEDKVAHLYRDGQLNSSWKMGTVEISIPDSISDELKKLGDSECPDKLKNATRTKLTFAAPIIDNRISPLSDAVLYSYLPTNASYKFNFLINADFLMDAQRTGLLQGIWNDFLFEKVAEWHLKWILQLQKTADYRFDALKLIRTRFTEGYPKSFQLAFNKALDNTLEETAFVLGNRSERFHIVKKCIVDNVGFSRFFDESKLRDFLQLPDDHVVVNYSYQATSKLTDLGAKSFTSEDVFTMINRKFFTGWEESHQLSRFLHHGAQNFNSISWDKNCAASEFIADENEVFRSPKDIFFPFKHEEELPDIDMTELHFVNGNILDIYDKLEFKDLPDWLDSLGVRQPTLEEVVKKSIIPMVEADKINNGNAVRLTRILVRVHALGNLSPNHYEVLSKMKLVTANGMIAAGKCYLPVQYGGDQELQQIMVNGDFVSTLYVEGMQEEEIPHYSTFFKKIGCSATITVVTIEDTVSVAQLQQRHPESIAFFDWLERTDVIPVPFRRYRLTQHSYSGFNKVDFRGQLNNFGFSKYFWTGVLNNWDVFLQRVGSGKYYVYGGSFDTISYIQYYAQEHAVVPCTDGQCHLGKESFSPTLRNVVGSFYPVADFPMSLTAPQRDFFGFKKTISVEECLHILSKLSEGAVDGDNVKQLFAVYGQIVGMGIQHDPKSVKSIRDWCNNGLLITHANTFGKLSDLWYFDMQALETNSNASIFLKLPDNMEQEARRAFCELFNIPVVTIDELEFSPKNPQINHELPQRVMGRIRHLALLSSHKNMSGFEDVLRKMTGVLRSTQFFEAESIDFVYRDENGKNVYQNHSYCSNIKGQGFYFVGNWRKARTLFEIISPLCELLSISDLAREAQLLMQLDDEDARDWLTERGHDLECLKVQTPDLFEIVQEDREVTEAPEMSYDIKFESGSFEPDIQPEDLDIEHFQPIIKDYSPGNTTPSKSYARPTDQKFTGDVGKWSEDFVYRYLLANPDQFSNVVWVNEQEESYLPYDFECIENGEPLFIDAKGTTSADKAEIYLSPQEWEFLFEKGSNYSMFRVYQAGSTRVRFERIDNISLRIKKAEILPTPFSLIL